MPALDLLERRQRLFLLAAAASLLAACDCGYGGPGCGLPGLEGLCEARMEKSQSAMVTAVYGDDTGYHPAEVHTAETADGAILGVMRTPNPGELLLTATSAGETALRLTVDGWGDRVFTWTFTVADGPVTAPSACPDALIPDPEE